MQKKSSFSYVWNEMLALNSILNCHNTENTSCADSSTVGGVLGGYPAAGYLYRHGICVDRWEGQGVLCQSSGMKQKNEADDPFI